MTQQYVAVVVRSDGRPAQTVHGNHAAFLSPDRDAAIRQALASATSWSDRNLRNGVGTRYEVQVGVLTHVAKIKPDYVLEPVRDEEESPF